MRIGNYVSPNDWTPEQNATLREMWLAGKTTGIIALALGRTTSSIIGRAHRMGLPRRPNPIKREVAPRAPKPRHAPMQTLPPIPSRPIFVAPPPRPVEPPAEIEPRRGPARKCEWPSGHSRRHGGKGITFDCTRPALPDKRYCACHWQQGHQPVPVWKPAPGFAEAAE